MSRFFEQLLAGDGTDSRGVVRSCESCTSRADALARPTRYGTSRAPDGPHIVRLCLRLGAPLIAGCRARYEASSIGTYATAQSGRTSSSDHRFGVAGGEEGLAVHDFEHKVHEDVWNVDP